MTKVVFTCGVFDIFHHGHLSFLKRCKRYGEILVVQVLGDKVVRKTKGKDRPVMNEKRRAEIVASLKCVDKVFISNDYAYSPKILNKVHPNIIVKVNAKKYTPKLKREFIDRLKKNHNIKVVFQKRTTGISTTKIINSIKQIP